MCCFDSLDELAEFLRAHADGDGDELFGFSLAMFEHADEERPLVRALLGRRGGAVVQARFQYLLAELVRGELTTRTRRDKPPTPALELIVTGVVGAYVALLARWLDEDDPQTPRQMDEAFRRLVIPGVRAALHLEVSPQRRMPRAAAT